MKNLESYRQDIIDAAVEWQSYWSENIHDKQGISSRQGYLYDRVRHYRKALEEAEKAGVR